MMKRTVKLLVAMLLVTMALFLTAAAVATPEVTLSLNEIADTNGGHDMIVNVHSLDGKVNAFEVVFTFNNTILLPADCADYTSIPVDTVADEPVYPASITVGKKTYSYALTETTWTTDGDYTTLKVGCYTTDGDKFDANDLDLLAISFVFADGKTIKDITADDFVVKSMYIADGVNGEYGYNMASAPTPIIFTNNVIPAPTTLTVPVAKGDVVYLQDGSSAVAAEAGDYEIPTADGYVTVNTGYTAQKVYKVADGVVTEQTELANGVLADGAAALRNDATASGLRFRASFLTSVKSNVKEYGYLVTAESAYNNLPEDYTLDLALAASGKAKKGVAYNPAENIDIFFDVDGARTVVTAVATNIPLTKEGVTTNIVARPYYILENGTVIYGETVTRQMYEVAYLIKKENGEAYRNNKEYIDSIIALVPASSDFIVIEMGPLF